jgi:hypothetical protein
MYIMIKREEMTLRKTRTVQQTGSQKNVVNNGHANVIQKVLY